MEAGIIGLSGVVIGGGISFGASWFLHQRGQKQDKLVHMRWLWLTSMASLRWTSDANTASCYIGQCWKL